MIGYYTNFLSFFPERFRLLSQDEYVLTSRLWQRFKAAKKQHEFDLHDQQWPSHSFPCRLFCIFLMYIKILHPSLKFFLLCFVRVSQVNSNRIAK